MFNFKSQKTPGLDSADLKNAKENWETQTVKIVYLDGDGKPQTKEFAGRVFFYRMKKMFHFKVDGITVFSCNKIVTIEWDETVGAIW